MVGVTTVGALYVASMVMLCHIVGGIMAGDVHGTSDTVRRGDGIMANDKRDSMVPVGRW